MKLSPEHQENEKGLLHKRIQDSLWDAGRKTVFNVAERNGGLYKISYRMFRVRDTAEERKKISQNGCIYNKK